MGRVSKVKEGDVYNYWTVLYCSGKNPQGKIMWMCRCKCGEEREVIGYNLTSNRSKSCGCFQKENKGSQWTGVGEMSGNFINHIIIGAEKRNISYNLEKEYLWELFLKQERKCALSGLDIGFAPTNEPRDSYLKTASLDRIDSSKSYEVGNVQWVHKDINIMKNSFSEEHFKELCRLVIKKDSETSGGACEITRI